MKTCQLTSMTVSVFLVAVTGNASALAPEPAHDSPTAHSKARPERGVGSHKKKASISTEARAASQAARGGGATCSGDATALLFPLDGTYGPVNFCALPVTGGFDQAQCTGDPPDQHNDDDSSAIPLNFTFSLFGDTYTTLRVSNNGVLSLGSGIFEEFEDLAFPDPTLPPLVAPFWADVDTGQADTVQHGDVWFKQFDSDGSGSDDTLVVTWENVGYENDHGDLLNTFQVIISDGTNPVMGLGTDLCFSYDTMCWTTGDFRGGVGGFGSPAATVGVNRGDGVEFFQAGRFDHAGADFDGPFGAADGVSYLDGRVICFAPCDGAGDCDDSNVCTDDACTNGVCEHTPAARRVACGDPGDTECDNPDTCDAGVCQSNNEPGGTSCGDPGDTDCDNPDTCDGAGACQANLEPGGTSCGDPSDTDCENPDTCDGAGVCDDNDEADGVPCGDPTDDDCANPDTCLAAVCQDNDEAAGTACGDPGDAECDNPDTCDGAGVCESNNEPGGTSCGDPGDTECDNPDTCDAGACQSNNEPGGTSCGDPDDTDCDNPDTCDGAGACQTNLEAADTPCGDPGDTDCDNPDTCDGAGVCESNNEPAGTICTDEGNECTDDVCDAGGTCTHPPFLDGTPCTDDEDPGTDDLCEGGVCLHIPIPGACCVGVTGLCSDPVFLADCQGPLDKWTDNATCGQVTCPRHVPAGIDCYEVACSISEFNFFNDPIPADFFAPGSEPFNDAIGLSGAGTGDPNYDFSIERLDDMVFGQVFPSERTVDIELVSLNLVSCEPIEVRMPGGEMALWNVAVGLSSTTPPNGTLTATKEHENGGVFTQTYFIQAKYTFSSVDDPSLTRTFDTGQRGIAPIEEATVGVDPWVHSADIDASPCGVAFLPGVEDGGGGRGPVTPCCRRNRNNRIVGGTVGCLLCEAGACCDTEEGLGAPALCENVIAENNRNAKQRCELPEAGGGKLGTYIDTMDCDDDEDCDRVPDFMETETGDCAICPDKAGLTPEELNLYQPLSRTNFDSDSDGCGDGDENDMGTNPCDPCDRPAAACPNPPAGAGCPGPLPDRDCDDNDVSDLCEILQDPTKDCGAPADVSPNFTPDGIPDTCQPSGFFGACCSSNACLDTDPAGCVIFGGVFQGFCTKCPTNLPVATHRGQSIVHFSSPPPVCTLVRRSAGTEDCSLRTMYYDSWQTDLGGGDQMCHEFGLPGGTPEIPADFFGPGSLAFGGLICLEGEPLGFISIDVPGGPLIEGEFGDADTMVLRSDDPFGRCATNPQTADPVIVQVIALSLTSVGPFTVEFDSDPNQTWTAKVSVSDTPIEDLPLGSLTADKTHCNGGTYNSVLNVLPKFTFTKVGDPQETRILDFGPEPGFDPVELTQDTAPQWVHEKEGDLDLADDPCTEFRPGVEAINVQTVCDCNSNGQRDLCDIETEFSGDCNGNAIPDDCDVNPSDPDANGLVSVDCNQNGVPDECEDDCNANGIADSCDITAGTSQDINLNGTPDECEPDCNGNGIPDGVDLSTGASSDCLANGIPDECEVVSGVNEDCNENAAPDNCDLADGTSQDCNGNGVPDECELKLPTLAAAPHDILKNRYISILTNNFNACGYDIRITLTSSLVSGVTGVGSQWWANSPDAECISIMTSTRPAQAPDFSPCATLHLAGCPIIPTSNYDIFSVVRGNAIESAPALAVATQAKPGIKWHGDCVGIFTGTEWTAPNNQVNIDDAVAAIKTFQNPSKTPGCGAPPCNATHTSVTDMEPNLTPGPQINKVVNIADVFSIILGFQGFEYPGAVLTQCP